MSAPATSSTSALATSSTSVSSPASLALSSSGSPSPSAPPSLSPSSTASPLPSLPVAQPNLSLREVSLRDLLRPTDGNMHYLGHTVLAFAPPADPAQAKAYDWLPNSWKAFVAWRIQAFCFGLELLQLDRTICRLAPNSPAAEMRRYDRLMMLRAVWGGHSPMVDTRLFTSDNWLVRKPAITALHALVASWGRSENKLPESVPSTDQAAFEVAERTVLKAYAQTYVDVFRRYPPFPLARPQEPWA